MVAALTVVAASAYAQTGEVTNSKYLEIIEHTYRVGESSDTITGTVKNISTEEVSSITIYLLLYDKANQLITIETRYADLTPLRRHSCQSIHSTYSVTAFCFFM